MELKFNVMGIGGNAKTFDSNSEDTFTFLLTQGKHPMNNILDSILSLCFLLAVL